MKDAGNYLVIVKPGDTKLGDGKPLSKPPELDELHDAVGGYLEVVPYLNTLGGRPCVAFCNEDGKVKGLVPNDLATLLWSMALNHRSPPGGDYLVGPVAFIVGSQDFLDLMKEDSD